MRISSRLLIQQAGRKQTAWHTPQTIVLSQVTVNFIVTEFLLVIFCVVGNPYARIVVIILLVNGTLDAMRLGRDETSSVRLAPNNGIITRCWSP